MAEPKTEIKPARDSMERIRKLPREVLKYMEPIPLFQDMSTRERAMFSEMGEVARCPGGTKIFEGGEEGKYLLIVLQGRLELRTPTGAGMSHAVREMALGQVVGVDAVLLQAPYHMTCLALENTAALRFQTVHLHRMIEQGLPAGIKIFVALRAELAAEIRTATLEVARLLEQTSVRGSNKSWDNAPQQGGPLFGGPATPLAGLKIRPLPGGNPSRG
ncbi:MAG: cyclic nucleotide-binding domain-containing protein [Myxococcales bacterium]|nr:cyclic nucleotide-binding domain-containing protein [Myxococcales bacterium]